MQFTRTLNNCSNCLDPRQQWHGFFPKFRNPVPKTLSDDQRDFLASAQEREGEAQKEVEIALALSPDEAKGGHDTLEKQGARNIFNGSIEAVFYDLSTLCNTLSGGERMLCKRRSKKASARVRSITNEHGETQWFWALKIPNGGHRNRLEIEARAENREEAERALKAKLMAYFRVPSPRLEKMAEGKGALTFTKSRHSYRFEPPRAGLPCSHTQIDFDIFTMINGHEVEPAFLSVDIEGPDEEAVENCARCLGFNVANEYDLRTIINERGYSRA